MLFLYGSDVTNHFVAKSHFWIDILIDNTFAGSLADVFGRMPAAILAAPFLLPGDLMKKKKMHDKLILEKITSRMSKPNDRADFFSHLLSDDTVNKDPKFFLTNASTLIIAGSETTATTMYSCTYFLLQNPTALKRLQDEIRTTFTKPPEVNGDTTEGLKYLSGTIEEALRLFPPAAFGLQRVSPGAVVSGHYVPKGVSTKRS
jgi:cytochrome P450